MITTPIPLPLENITVYEGDNATNTCKAMCDYPPWFEWYIYVGKGKNKQRKPFIPDLDVEDTSGNGYTWMGDTPRYMGINFRIDNVTKEDERYYYCEIALDANGESYTESIFFYLHVLPKPVTTLPTTGWCIFLYVLHFGQFNVIIIVQTVRCYYFSNLGPVARSVDSVNS